MPPSSSGLGRSPFKATTGVRIPVGALEKIAVEAIFVFYDLGPHSGDDIQIPVPFQDASRGALEKIAVEAFLFL